MWERPPAPPRARPAKRYAKLLCRPRRVGGGTGYVRESPSNRPPFAQTRRGGRGAFAPCGGITRRASFVGVYRTRCWRRGDRSTPLRRQERKNDYVFQVGSWRAAPSTGRPGLGRYPVMAIQEPPPNVDANCVPIFFSKACEIGAPGKKSAPIACVAVYTRAMWSPARNCSSGMATTRRAKARGCANPNLLHGLCTCMPCMCDFNGTPYAVE